ncbi:olfactory receptor 1038-like [Rhinatrema bivittatum]|uniref:olfactory receptor 1038-like n=1 Tax=Rhinatrema bivittatum TaxID=194408 RepID=UPI0011273836|nr:olfactory receptor 1038-like [Rhinatrema bivittatum]
MEENKTLADGFLLLGFSRHSPQPFLTFIMVLLAFLISVLGNLGFLTLMCSDHRLHKPMYFFLSNLSFLDICNTSVTLSTLLESLLKEKTFISFSLCMTQLCFFLIFISTEFFLLTAMAYDRYVAICRPLHYTVMMNKRICILLVATSWITGCLDILPMEILISRFSYCGANEINHFFCDPNSMMKLSCSDTHNLEALILIEAVLFALIPFILTLASYTFIIAAILRIHSTQGRLKAFSTCSSHLTVVILFYGTLISIYMRPNSMSSPDSDKFFSLLYTTLIPVLNPIIYTLRNKEVKNALRKVGGRKY